MFSAACRHSLVTKVPKAFNVRFLTSAAVPSSGKKEEVKKSQHCSFHSSASLLAEPPAASAKSADAVPPIVEEIKQGGMGSRFITTFEVTVSKIFPAGFGWQTSSIVAEQAGFAGDSLNFALTTGVGDAIGVLGGHVLYYGIKKSAVDSSINMTNELHTAILLGSAAFCSGTAWQPCVNALQGANLPFNQVFLGTWLGCGLAFYGGLRVARTLLSSAFNGIEEPTYANSLNDGSLSISIGGATAFFVGTDIAYFPEQNFLANVVGIQDGTPDIVGCAIAGTSTSLGFATSQTALNIAYPSGKCWND